MVSREKRNIFTAYFNFFESGSTLPDRDGIAGQKGEVTRQKSGLIRTGTAKQRQSDKAGRD
jgi:hypothetical protein